MKQICFSFIFICFFNNIFSQSIEKQPYTQVLYQQLFLGSLRQTGRVYASPLKFKAKEWLITAGLAGGVALSMTQDHYIQQHWGNDHRALPDFMATYIGQPLGNGYFALLAPLGTYLISSAFREPEVSQPALTVFQATAISSSIVLILKESFHRQRPEEGRQPDPDPQVWYGPGLSGDHLSFPSEHTADAFAIAAALSTYYKGHLWVGITGYSLAAITGWSRIHDNKHWLSDVLTGAIIGTFVGKTVANPEKFKWRIISGPQGNPGLGVALSF